MDIEELIAKLVELKGQRTSTDPEVYCRNNDGYFRVIDVEIDADGGIVICIQD